jgi:cell wall-associated NlpC family hydrolase
MPKHFLVGLPQIHAVLMDFIDFGGEYAWGGKVQPISRREPHGVNMDCSGATRWIMYHASEGKLNLPDGSTSQRDHCERMGFEKVPYSKAIQDNTGAVFLCFAWNLKAKERHVWIVRMRASWESWSGNGSGVRSPKSLWHRLHCRACYRIA